MIDDKEHSNQGDIAVKTKYRSVERITQTIVEARLTSGWDVKQ